MSAMTTITNLILANADQFSLTIIFNDHWSVYETVQDGYSWTDPSMWVDYDAAVLRNSVWDVSKQNEAGETTYRRLASSLSCALNGPRSGESCLVSERLGRIMRDLPHTLEIRYIEYDDEVIDLYDDPWCWISEDDHLTALISKRVWEVIYYPDTPVGYCTGVGSTLENALGVFVR